MEGHGDGADSGRADRAAVAVCRRRDDAHVFGADHARSGTEGQWFKWTRATQPDTLRFVIDGQHIAATMIEGENLTAVTVATIGLGEAGLTLDYRSPFDDLERRVNDQAVAAFSVVDLNARVDSDNNAGWGDPDAADDTAETQGAAKLIPVNENDDDGDGIPDYADGFELEPGRTESFTNMSENFAPLDLILTGFYPEDRNRLQVRFDFATAPLTDRPTSQPCPLIHSPDGSVDASGRKIDHTARWAYRRPSDGPLRLWMGETIRTPDGRILPGTLYGVDTLLPPGQWTGRLFLEGINETSSEQIEATLFFDGEELCDDMTFVSVVEVNITVNSDNDREFLLEEEDDAIEDQDMGFVFWATSKNQGRIDSEGMGHEDLMAVDIRIPPSASQGGFEPVIRIARFPDNGFWGMSCYDRTGHGPREHITDSTWGSLLTTASATALVWMTTGDDEYVLPSSVGEYLFSIYGEQKYTISVGLRRSGNPGVTMLGDSVVVTAVEPEDWFYAFESARGDRNTLFQYPLDTFAEPTSVTMYRYPDVTTSSLGHWDSTKENYSLFVHGFNNTASFARMRARILFKRLFWQGYRDNFAAITWFGDYGYPDFDLIQAPFFFHDVEHALQTSPSYYKFLREEMMGRRAILPTNIYLLAHSLGNLVTWDALRINARFGQDKIARDVFGFEGAVWEEAFWPQEPEVYEWPDDPTSYTVASLRNHSWKYWFRQEGANARSAIIGQVHHGYYEDDNGVLNMPWGDYILHSYHYSREAISLSPEAPRNTENFGSIPALIQHGYRRIFDPYASPSPSMNPTPTSSPTPSRSPSLTPSPTPTPSPIPYPPPPYSPDDLNRPIGVTADLAIDHRAFNSYQNGGVLTGWRPKKHSDCFDLPVYLIWPWYEGYWGNGSQGLPLR